MPTSSRWHASTSQVGFLYGSEVFRELRRKISAVRAQQFLNRPQNLDVTRTGNGERE